MSQNDDKIWLEELSILAVCESVSESVHLCVSLCVNNDCVSVLQKLLIHYLEKYWTFTPNFQHWCILGQG